MKKEFELSHELLDELSDEEINLLVELAPKKILLDYIKRHQKKFKNEIKGVRLDLRSDILHKRMSKIYINRLRSHDQGVIKLFESFIGLITQNVDNIAMRKEGYEDFLEKAVLSRDTNDFSKLLDALSEFLEPRFFKLFFKLIGEELSDIQSDYVDKYCMKKKLEGEILKRVEDEYNDRIQILEERIRTVQGMLDESKSELYNEKKANKLLKDDIENITLQKEEHLNILKLRNHELDLKAQKLEDEKVELESGIKSKDAIIDKLEDILNLRFEDFNSIAQEKWEKDNRDLLNKQEQLRIECKGLEKTREAASQNIRILHLRQRELKDELLKYEEVVGDFVNNIDKKIIEKALNDSLLNYSGNGTIGLQEYNLDNNDLYIKKNEVAKNIDESKNIYDFLENIAANLEQIGVVNIEDEVASYIVGVLGAGLTPLICGYRARDIATAISISYSGETPYIVSLPNGYSKPREILDIYNKADSNVILIEDAIGTMNENALMPLLRERSQSGFSSKLLLLATENMDSVKYMPLNMYNHVALVRIDYHGRRKGNYQASHAQETFKEFSTSDFSNNEYKKSKKSVRGLLRDFHMSTSYEMLRSTIVMYSTKLTNSNLALKGYLRSELLFLCQCDNTDNTLDKLKMNIQNHRWESNLDEVFRGAYMDDILVRRISKDLGINKLANESYKDYGTRLLYTALGAWGRTLVFGESYADLDNDEIEKEDVSYHNVDILHIQSRLAQVAYGMLATMPHTSTWMDTGTMDEQSNKLASYIIDELIFCYELSPLKDSRRLTNSPTRIANFGDNQLLLGGEKWKVFNKVGKAAGLGRWISGNPDKENNGDDYRSLFNIPRESPDGYYDLLSGSAFWKEKSLDGQYQIFKTGTGHYYNKAWKNIDLSKLPQGISLLRNSNDSGGYFLANREGSSLYIAGLDSWYFQEREIYRLMYILDKQNKTPAVFNANIYNDHVVLHCHSHLPNPESRILILSSWPLNSYKDIYYRVIPLFVWNDIKILLTNAGIEIKCIRG